MPVTLFTSASGCSDGYDVFTCVTSVLAFAPVPSLCALDKCFRGNLPLSVDHSVFHGTGIPLSVW
eukprot:3089041-Pleurochrysis_carterae.AAC.1